MKNGGGLGVFLKYNEYIKMILCSKICLEETLIAAALFKLFFN